MKTVRFERHEGVGHIVLANPPHNLIATQFTNCLREAVHEASDSDIRALLVRAEGPNFSQGGDILDFIDKDFNSWRTFICETHHAYQAIEALQIPTVVAVRGAAYGGAFELALACDFIVAAENCTFRSLEASVGSAPVAGAVQRLPQRAGPALGARYAMLSEPMSRATARQLGVAAFVVPEAQGEGTAAALAKKLGPGPPPPYASIRALL